MQKYGNRLLKEALLLWLRLGLGALPPGPFIFVKSKRPLFPALVGNKGLAIAVASGTGFTPVCRFHSRAVSPLATPLYRNYFSFGIFYDVIAQNDIVYR
jgi:hypothetical protein